MEQAVDFSRADARIRALEACIHAPAPVDADEELLVGVDLGTAYIVVVALNAAGEPAACALRFAQVIRDGLVVDYMGAGRIVRELKDEIQRKLGRELTHAAIAVPPGTGERDSATHRFVVEGAGLEVVAVLDEPSAANAVLGIANGAIVDIGGGTTGLAVLNNGKVVYTADEPTGGTHLTLVLAGNYHLSFEEAEVLKKDPQRQKEILPVVQPVVQKMASIISRHVRGRNVSALYLVGGTCCLAKMESIIERETGIPTFKPVNPFLVTPLGIALRAFCY